MKRLSELDAKFYGAGGPGITNADGSPAPKRSGVGLGCDCPCGCGSRMYIGFNNPLDGGEPLGSEHPRWDRTGDTIDTLTLRPSIQRADPDGCKWHGYITDGAAEAC